MVNFFPFNCCVNHAEFKKKKIMASYSKKYSGLLEIILPMQVYSNFLFWFVDFECNDYKEIDP